MLLPKSILSNCLFTVAIFFSFQSWSQKVSSVEASVVDGKIEIVYRMTDLKPNQRFQVRLYSSADNYATAIDKNLSGDIGDEVRAVSVNKIVMSDPIGTLGEVTGDLNFKVKALLSYDPVRIVSPVVTKRKRGRKTSLVWLGGLKNDQVSIDLFKNDILITQNLYTAPNNAERKASFKFPSKVVLGEGYSMKMNFTSMEAPVEIPEFTVKRRTSIFGKVFRLALLAAVVDYAALDGDLFLRAIGVMPAREPDALSEPPSLSDLDNFR